MLDLSSTLSFVLIPILLILDMTAVAAETTTNTKAVEVLCLLEEKYPTLHKVLEEQLSEMLDQYIYSAQALTGGQSSMDNYWQSNVIVHLYEK